MIKAADTAGLPKLLVSLDEAAQMLGICPKSVWSITSPRGGLPCVRVGRSVRYSPAALQRWIDQQQAMSTEADR